MYSCRQLLGQIGGSCLADMYVAHGASSFFTGLALKHASSANVDNSRLFMSILNGGGGGGGGGGK